MKLSRAFMPLLGVTVLASSLLACVYSSDAPTPLSSGTDTTSTDGTEPTAEGGGGGGGGGGGDTDGSTGGGGGGTDSGTKQTGSDAGTKGTDAGQVVSGAPTWSTIYAQYFAAGTPGNCGASGCHASSKSGVKCSDKSTCYSTLTSAGYISGTQSALVDPQQTCLRWYGGNMPPSGGSSSTAKTDISAWVTAGAQNN